MLNTLFVISALCVPLSNAWAGPDQSPPVPDAVVDLRSDTGVALLQGQWRWTDAHIVDAANVAPGADNRPTTIGVKTHDIQPHVGTPEFDAAPWDAISPADLEKRRTNGKLAFGWYRLELSVPDHIGTFAATGADIVFEITVDDYAEVWVDGALPQVLGQSGGALVKGWNAPNRVVVAHDAKPGQTITLAIFAANGPLSNPPANYVWVRSATLDFYKPGRAMNPAPTPVKTDLTRLDAAFDEIVPPGTQAERLADGFSFGEGPVWVPAVTDARYGGGGRGGYLLFSDPNKNVIHRYEPGTGEVSIYRTKSGYTGIGGANIGEYHQPGSNGLALDPQGKLTICEHGNRRVTRLEPNGSLTVLADRFEGKRLNSPNDLVYRSDGTLYFTDPPFGLPKVFDDAAKEIAVSGVYCLHDGKLSQVVADLTGPNGLAFSPDEKFLYVDNWDEKRKVIMRYAVGADGSLAAPTTLIDLTPIQGEICLDGLKVDTLGNIYVSAPGGIRVFSADGKPLGIIALPELPANFAFGDSDGRTLYCTARTGLYRLRLGVPGVKPAR
ncbi:MAG: SMP-30/gluconolactonase/LRE family protein [Phycisphaerales bacterium]|jgi:gluconolactonase